MPDLYTVNPTSLVYDDGTDQFRIAGWRTEGPYTLNGKHTGSSSLKFADSGWKIKEIVFEKIEDEIKVGQKLRSKALGLEATVVAIWDKAKDNDNRGVALQWRDSSLGLYSKREVREFERIDE